MATTTPLGFRAALAQDSPPVTKQNTLKSFARLSPPASDLVSISMHLAALIHVLFLMLFLDLFLTIYYQINLVRILVPILLFILLVFRLDHLLSHRDPNLVFDNLLKLNPIKVQIHSPTYILGLLFVLPQLPLLFIVVLFLLLLLLILVFWGSITSAD